MRLTRLVLLLFTVALAASCSQTPKQQKIAAPKKDSTMIRPSLQKAIGRNFIEVKRVFSDGLRFNKYGYQLEPNWRLKLLAEDSVLLYSETKKRWTDFHVYFDHDSIFNMADNWLKLRKIDRDSIIFQVLSVGEDLHISSEWSNVYMTFYSVDLYDKLSKSAVHQVSDKISSGELANQKPLPTLKSLVYPGRRDTAYILKKSIEANKDHEKAFAARQPADMFSNSPLVLVHKVKVTDSKLNTDREAYEYLNPEFNITIYKAYRNFNYPMSVYIDENGKIIFRKSLLFAFDDEQAGQNRMMKGIVDGYLAKYITAVAGTTLNIPHTSIVRLNITGLAAPPPGK